MKQCSKCKEDKNLEDFPRDSYHKTGYASSCKLCRKATQSASRKKFREKRSVKNREYRENHPGWDAANQRKYRQSHPERVIYARLKRRAVKKGAVGDFTESEWQALLSTYGYKCLACGVAGVPLNRDHVVPLALGGCNFISNIQPLCKPCNGKKYTKIIDYRPNIVLLDRAKI